MAFWGIDFHGNDCLYQWRFLPFGLKNAPAKFQKVMDWVLENFNFAKYYINDIIMFSLTVKEHLQEVFDQLLKHNLKFYHHECQFFHT
jgi:hypothetical protein